MTMWRECAPHSVLVPDAAQRLFDGASQRFRDTRVGRRLVLAAEYPTASFDEHLGAGDDVDVGGVLGPVMADAADRRYEQHARGHDCRQHLRIMAGTAGHANGSSAGQSLARGFDRVL